MKKTNLSLALAGIMIASVAIVSSCVKKNATTTPDTDQSGASANNQAENTSNDVVSMGAQASDMTYTSTSNGSLSTYRNGNENQILGLSCATVTRDTIAKVITVTFNGSSACLDGRTRSGSIIYTYSNSASGAKHYRDPGFELDVTSNNYVVDGNAVTIHSKKVINTTPAGFNPATINETWSISADISIALSSGTINWTSNRIKTLLNTSTVYPANPVINPIDWAHAKIGITDGTGGTSGNRPNGETFSVTITNQLVRDFGGCRISGRSPFIQGTFIFAPAGKHTRTFDFGSGTCDLNATVTINGTSYPITLP